MPMTDTEIIEQWRDNVCLGDLARMSGRDQSEIYKMLVNTGELARSVNAQLDLLGRHDLKLEHVGGDEFTFGPKQD